MAVLPLLANYDQEFLPFYLTTDSSAWIQTLDLRINSTLFYNCTSTAGHPCSNLFAIFLSPGASGWFQTLDLRIISPLHHDGATAAGCIFNVVNISSESTKMG